MVMTLPKGRNTMTDLPEKRIRRVKVSTQRQLSIPKDFYDALDFEDEALVEFTGKEIIIRPATSENVDFSEDILKDLVHQGYSGEELIQEFARVKSNIPRALDFMKKEAMEQSTISGSLDDYLDSLEDEEEDE